MLLELPVDNPTLQEKFQKLSTGRKVIVLTYFEIHREDPRSVYHVIPKIVARLGSYTIDRNGTNTYLVQVIRQFFGK